MAMSPPPESAPLDPSGGSHRVMDTAIQQMRDHTDPRWVEIESDLLAHVLATSRPSHPLRARSALGPYAVSEQVLISYLRDALDRAPHCEVSAIYVHADDAVCTGITIVTTAQYGHRLVDVADVLRIAADDVISKVLGVVRPRVTVTDMHVHVDDISSGDPKRGDLQGP